MFFYAVSLQSFDSNERSWDQILVNFLRILTKFPACGIGVTKQLASEEKEHIPQINFLGRGKHILYNTLRGLVPKNLQNVAKGVCHLDQWYPPRPSIIPSALSEKNYETLCFCKATWLSCNQSIPASLKILQFRFQFWNRNCTSLALKGVPRSSNCSCSSIAYRWMFVFWREVF